jgi:hypothetical protein
MLTVPEHPFNLMAKVYREIFPLVHQELNMWREILAAACCRSSVFLMESDFSRHMFNS